LITSLFGRIELALIANESNNEQIKSKINGLQNKKVIFEYLVI